METLNHPDQESEEPIPPIADMIEPGKARISEEEKAKIIAMGEKYYRDRAAEARQQATENPDQASYWEAKAKYMDLYAAIASRNAQRRVEGKGLS